MAKQSPLEIMNLLGKAANKKAQMSGQNQAPNDEEDPLNSAQPSQGKAPQSVKSKQVAAMKEAGQGKAKMAPLSKQKGNV